MTENPTVEEMQNWDKKYKLDANPTKVIDIIDGGEYWTAHQNEAYNLCIELNKLYDENEQLKQNIEVILKYCREKGKYAMDRKEIKAHNVLQRIVNNWKGD